MEATTVLPAVPDSASDWVQVERLLALARSHLGMELAWLSEFADGEQIIRAASGDLGALQITLDEGFPLDDSYCGRVLAGTLPPVISDVRRHPCTRDLPITKAAGIGAYVGVPWRGQNGETAGMLCCADRCAVTSLDTQAGRFLGLIADLVSDHVNSPVIPDHRRVGSEEAKIMTILDSGAIRMVFQPVVRLSDGAIWGFEALARFDDPDLPTPAHAFAAAARVGLGVELELLAAECALERLDDIPPDVALGINLSAQALMTPKVEQMLLRFRGRDVGVELTEHTEVPDYAKLVEVTDRLRAAGLHIAVDDAGAGYASLRHILQLHPGVIKLDIAIIRGIDVDPARQALTRSLVSFAADIGAGLVAEGIEFQAEHDMLRKLGVELGQGYLMARPGPLPVMTALGGGG
jgi:EAL domain-containing protein (putative c-di-GMP-specific phosphodiesterase class I)